MKRNRKNGLMGNSSSNNLAENTCMTCGKPCGDKMFCTPHLHSQNGTKRKPQIRSNHKRKNNL